MSARAKRRPFTPRDRIIIAALVAAMHVGAVLVAIYYSVLDHPDQLAGYLIFASFVASFWLWQTRRALIAMATDPTRPPGTRPPPGHTHPPRPTR